MTKKSLQEKHRAQQIFHLGAGPGTSGRADNMVRHRNTLAEVVSLRKNPASLSPRLAGLFPPGVVGAELWTAGDPSLLYPEEKKYLGRATDSRTREFAAGRLCARRALASFGFSDYPLRMGSDRCPQWPVQMIGSITHATGICGAVVADRERFRGIGVDAEIVADVTQEIWPTICTSDELGWLTEFPAVEQGRYAALIFCAKESFYKCQYGITRQWLDFRDVTLDFAWRGSDAGDFMLRPRRKIALLERDAMSLIGRFEFHENFIMTGIALRTP